MTEKLLTESFDENYKKILENIAVAAERSGRKSEDITLLAATKTVSPEIINHAIESGIEFIGENRVQEFLKKEPFVTQNVHKHFIGHLQTNKVKDIVGKVEMIESVSSLKLAGQINKISEQKNIVTDILLEVNIGKEESKSGFFADEVTEAVDALSEFKNIRLCGLMAIPPVLQEIGANRPYFEKMFKLFIDISGKKMDNRKWILSMGMSDDYAQAIECGSNLVRVGTALFGQRTY